MRKSSNFLLLKCGRAEHHADWNWKNVSSPFARLYWVESGVARVHVDNTIYTLTPGYIYFIPPFHLHGYECDDHFTLCYFHVYELPSSKIRIMEEYNFPFGIEARSYDASLFDRLLQINPGKKLLQYDPSHYDTPSTLLSDITRDIRNPYHISLETDGIISQFISRFLQEASPRYDIGDNRILDVLSYIRRNQHKEITIAELAMLCFLSPDHFIRLFKKHLRMTPIEYINRRRIEQAQLLLITTARPVKDIACEVAFYNIPYFNRVFRAVTGMTPVQYRQNV